MDDADCRQVQGAGCEFLGTAAEGTPCLTDSADSGVGGLDAGEEQDSQSNPSLEGGGAGYGCATLSSAGWVAAGWAVLVLVRRRR